MAPSLAHFPDVCLQIIFKNVPISDLFRSIGLVCRNWYKLRRIELKKRRRLVIADREGQLENLYHNMLYSPYQTDMIQYVRRDDGSWTSFESSEQIKFDAVLISDGILNISSTSSLMFMSNITRLTLALNDLLNSTLIRVIRIIEHFSEHLIDLRLALGFDSHKYLNDDVELEDRHLNGDVLANLFDSLRRLPSLQHLGLNQSFYNFFYAVDRVEQLPFLPRLTTFSLYFETNLGDDHDGWILPLLLPHVPSIDSCKIYNSFQVEDLLAVDPKLDTKFSVLSLAWAYFEDYENILLFCSRFSSLTKLNIVYREMPMTMLAQCLCQLPQLVHLEIMDFPPETEESESDEDGEQFDEEGEQSDEEEEQSEEDGARSDEEEQSEEEEESESNEDGERSDEEEEQSEEEEESESDEEVEQPQPEISQVPSVRMLTLTLKTKSHHDTERLFIPEIFPNLQVLSLKHYLRECPDCGIRPLKHRSYHRIIDSKFPRRISECKRLTREPFRRCLNLHIVALGDSDYYNEN